MEFHSEMDMERTLIADIQEKVLKEILKGERIFPTTIYFRQDGEKHAYVIGKEDYFVEVQITFRHKDKRSKNGVNYWQR